MVTHMMLAAAAHGKPFHFTFPEFTFMLGILIGSIGLFAIEHRK